MKLHIGAVPEDPAFQPEATGWSALKEPGPWQLQLITAPVALLIAAGLVFGFTLAFPHVVPTGDHSLLFSLGQAVVLVILLVPMHEISHAICAPNLGRSAHTLIGVWPHKLLFYVHHAGEMPRNRFVVLLLAPFVVLSLLPLLTITTFWGPKIDSAVFVFIGVLSVMNGIASSGDLLEAVLIVFQVPRAAVIRNQGWKSYWKAI